MSKISVKIPPSIIKIAEWVIPFFTSIHFMEISKEAWIVSFLLLVASFIIVMISFNGKKKLTFKGILNGSYSVILTALLSFCIGTTATTLWGAYKTRNKEAKEQAIKQQLFDENFEDADNIRSSYEYFHERGEVPNYFELKRINCPERLQNSVIGYYYFREGRYGEARYFFQSDIIKRPIAEYYLGLMNYLGLDDSPKPEEGLKQIKHAADKQQQDALTFMFYKSVHDEEVNDAEKYANDILFKHECPTRVYSDVLMAKVDYYIDYLNNQWEVFSLMNDYLLNSGESEKGIDLVDRFMSQFNKDENMQNLRIILTLNHLMRGGNSHHINSYLRSRMKEGSIVAKREYAIRILGTDNEIQNRKTISNRDFQLAESYLREALVKGDVISLVHLQAVYEAMGDSLKSLEADHVYSLVKMMSDAERQ